MESQAPTVSTNEQIILSSSAPPPQKKVIHFLSCILLCKNHYWPQNTIIPFTFLHCLQSAFIKKCLHFCNSHSVPLPHWQISVAFPLTVLDTGTFKINLTCHNHLTHLNLASSKVWQFQTTWDSPKTSTYQSSNQEMCWGWQFTCCTTNF